MKKDYLPLTMPSREFTKSIYTLFITLFLVSTSSLLFAQKYEMIAGINANKPFVLYKSQLIETKLKPGFFLGVNRVNKFSEKWTFQTSLILQQKSHFLINYNKVNSPVYTETNFLLTSFEIPIIWSYDFVQRDNMNVAFGLGPFVGFHVAGRYNYDLEDYQGNSYQADEKVEFSFTENTLSHVRRLDFGLNAQLRAEIARFSIQLNACHGINNLVFPFSDKSNRYLWQSRWLSIGFGYVLFDMEKDI